MIRHSRPFHAGPRRLWPCGMLLFLAAAAVPQRGLAQGESATPLWSHDLLGPEFSGLVPLWISRTGRAVATDLGRRTMRFMASLSAPAVERKVHGKILGEVGDTLIIRDGTTLLFFTIDGTLRRILPVTPATIPASEHHSAVAVSPGPLVLAVGAGDTLALQGSLAPGIAADGRATQSVADHLVWWQSADGTLLSPPLAVPQTDCVRDIQDNEKNVMHIVPPYCGGAGQLSAVLPNRRLALIDAPQGAGADGSFRLLIVSSAGDTILARRFVLPPRLITDSMWHAALMTPLFASGRLKIPATARPAITFPVSEVRAAPRDGVWIRPAFDDDHAEWWRVDEKGTLRSIVRLPEPMNVVALTDSELITVSSVKGGKRVAAWRASQ